MNENATVCQRDHAITLLNFENNAVVTYALILIRGTIRNSASCNEKLYIKHYYQDLVVKSIGCLVYNSNFKCLLLLQPSCNIIYLNYCHNTVKLSIIYNKSNSPYIVTPVLITCTDHNTTVVDSDNYLKSIDSSYSKLILAIQLMQCFYAEKVLEKTFVRKTFNIEYENDRPKCIIHKSKLTLSNAKEMNELDLWQYFGKELMTSNYGTTNRKFLALLTNSMYVCNGNICSSYDAVKMNTICYVCMGKGNLALIGNPFFYMWPENLDLVSERFQDSNPELSIKKSKQTDPLIQTIGGCYSLSFGAALHELGHIFDLGHTQYGLMGREYINVDKVFSFGRYDINPQRPYGIVCNASVENINSTKSNKSFTNLKKPTLLKSHKYQYSDIDKDCAYILFFHKWFNNYIIEKNISKYFNFDFNLNELVALNYLGVVQLRQVEHELVEYCWSPETKSCKWVMDSKYFGRPWYLFAIDVVGNIFHCVTKS